MIEEPFTLEKINEKRAAIGLRPMTVKEGGPTIEALNKQQKRLEALQQISTWINGGKQ